MASPVRLRTSHGFRRSILFDDRQWIWAAPSRRTHHCECRNFGLYGGQSPYFSAALPGCFGCEWLSNCFLHNVFGVSRRWNCFCHRAPLWKKANDSSSFSKGLCSFGDGEDSQLDREVWLLCDFSFSVHARNSFPGAFSSWNVAHFCMEVFSYRWHSRFDQYSDSSASDLFLRRTNSCGTSSIQALDRRSSSYFAARTRDL